MEQRKLNEIEYIFLHCTDSDLDIHDNIETVTLWHLSRGWEDIGYNYLITKDGERFYGRSLFYVGAHARGYNRNAISICLTGKDQFSIEQEYSVFTLIMDILEDYKIKEIKYHRDVNKNKTCPNFEWGWIARLNEKLKAEYDAKEV